MSELLHELIFNSAQRDPNRDAISHNSSNLSYAELTNLVSQAAKGFLALGLERQDRVAVFLPKRFETVIALFATVAAGGVFVPVNPVLKPAQVLHILRDSGARLLVTTNSRALQLQGVIGQCPDLTGIVLTESLGEGAADRYPKDVFLWQEILELSKAPSRFRTIDTDIAGLLYTSGSTGAPKGVVLSHQNMVTGAKSVAQYLENTPSDRILGVLPFSFDYGFSQMSTAFVVGACCVLMDYLQPREVIKKVCNEGITGLAAVPPLWTQLTQCTWPQQAIDNLRYITNSGGAMPGTTLDTLRRALPQTKVYLMYGLTEAFRSTYLPPEELDRRPESIGKAIPNAEILVLREDGSPCDIDEPGELVSRGSLVARGYWKNPEMTAKRFRPFNAHNSLVPVPELAVWSGDTVRMDKEGFLYFIGRKDEMIKTSGYRVSPTEIEEVIYASGMVKEAAAVGLPHPMLGQAIVVVIVPVEDELDKEALFQECKKNLPHYMVPAHVEIRISLPRNPNGKIDRSRLTRELETVFNVRDVSGELGRFVPD